MSQGVPNARLDCGTLYTTIFRLFPYRGPKHFPEEAEVRLSLSLFLSYISRIPYRPLPSGAQKQSAERYRCKRTHKSSSGTDVVCRLSFTVALPLWTVRFPGQELPFSDYNAQHSKDGSGDNTGTPTVNEHGECQLVSGRTPPQKPNKPET